MFQLKNVFIIAHWVGWLLVFSLTVLFLSENRSVTEVLPEPGLWVFFLIYIFIFYINILWLIPAFLFQKKTGYYFLFILLILSAIAFIKPFDRLVFERNRHEMKGRALHAPDRPPPDFEQIRPDLRADFHAPENEGRKVDVVSVFLFGLLWALGFALKISERWRDSEQRAIQAEADRANAELSFLKAQINPHFLFNTLNNIYSMAVTNNKKNCRKYHETLTNNAVCN